MRAPVGVFDSGVGGLSVLHEIRRELPREDLVYFADSGHAPYGDKPARLVRDRAIAIVDFLQAQGVKAVVAACNTATGIAVADLRARYAFPIVAIEPAVKPAAVRTRSGVIGVLATAGTLSTRKFQDLVSSHAGSVRVLTQACPGLAEQVERGALASPATRELVDRFVRPIVGEGADTLVLGCTHYSFLRDMIQAAAGEDVTLVDPAPAVARELRRQLAAGGLCAPAGERGTERFWTTGDVPATRELIERLWAGGVDLRQVPG